jgi:hypothetical protein
MRLLAMIAIFGLWPWTAEAQTRTRPAKPPAKPAATAPFKTTMTVDQMKGKQAVVETTKGTFVIQLLPEAAPNHVGHFIAEATRGTYDGTTFHRAVRLGIVQGGDPL